MKALAAEIIRILVAIAFAMIGAEASDEKGEVKTQEAINIINQELDDAEGLVRPWWLPAGPNTNSLLKLGIKALCAWEKKMGFFPGLKRWFESMGQRLSASFSSAG